MTIQLMLRTALVFGSLAVVVAPAQAAAPFGIPMGTPIKMLRGAERVGSMTYRVTPVAANPNFDSYYVQATPPHGVCAVYARTPHIADSKAFTAKFYSIVKLLSIYGTPRTVKPGPDFDFMNSTPSEFTREWRGKLPNNLSSITVEKVDIRGEKMVEVVYYYHNMDQCSVWEPKQDRTGL